MKPPKVEITEEDYRRVDETLCQLLAERAGVDKALCLQLAKAVREGKMRPDEALKRMGVKKSEFSALVQEAISKACSCG